MKTIIFEVSHSKNTSLNERSSVRVTFTKCLGTEGILTFVFYRSPNRYAMRRKGDKIEFIREEEH